MFYKPDKEWLIVLPINHILGRVPWHGLRAYLAQVWHIDRFMHIDTNCLGFLLAVIVHQL
jgi:hypothetical protein